MATAAEASENGEWYDVGECRLLKGVAWLPMSGYGYDVALATPVGDNWFLGYALVAWWCATLVSGRENHTLAYCHGCWVEVGRLNT